MPVGAQRRSKLGVRSPPVVPPKRPGGVGGEGGGAEVGGTRPLGLFNNDKQLVLLLWGL